MCPVEKVAHTFSPPFSPMLCDVKQLHQQKQFTMRPDVGNTMQVKGQEVNHLVFFSFSYLMFETVFLSDTIS